MAIIYIIFLRSHPPTIFSSSNVYGETPLHQVVGQKHPSLVVVRAIMQRCPLAFRKRVRDNPTGRLPVHVALLNNHLGSDTNVQAVARMCIAAYPPGVFEEASDNTRILRINGPPGGDVRHVRIWTPYRKARADIPLIFAYIECLLADWALRRTRYKLAGSGGGGGRGGGGVGGFHQRSSFYR